MAQESVKKLVQAMNEGNKAAAGPAAPAQGGQQDMGAALQGIIKDPNEDNTPVQNAQDIDTLAMAVLMIVDALKQVSERHVMLEAALKAIAEKLGMTSNQAPAAPAPASEVPAAPEAPTAPAAQ